MVNMQTQRLSVQGRDFGWLTRAGMWGQVLSHPEPGIGGGGEWGTALGLYSEDSGSYRRCADLFTGGIFSYFISNSNSNNPEAEGVSKAPALCPPPRPPVPSFLPLPVSK